jgi:hypothetical protein
LASIYIISISNHIGPNNIGLLVYELPSGLCVRMKESLTLKYLKITQFDLIKHCSNRDIDSNSTAIKTQHKHDSVFVVLRSEAITESIATGFGEADEFGYRKFLSRRWCTSIKLHWSL